MTGSAACRSNTLSSPQRLSSTLLRIIFNMISMYVWITCTPNPLTLEAWHPLDLASTPPTHSEADCLSAQIIYEQPFIFKYICTHTSYIYVCSCFKFSNLQLPFLFFYFVLDMPSLWYRWQWSQCPCCSRWTKILTCQETTFRNAYCGACWRWWRDMHQYIWWPSTVACMVMLATRSVQDNPHAVP